MMYYRAFNRNGKYFLYEYSSPLASDTNIRLGFDSAQIMWDFIATHLQGRIITCCLLDENACPLSR